MQPQESMGVTRRPLDVEDYIDVVRRHKAWIFGPTFAGLVIAVVVAFLWPDTYVSTAVIRVVPPQISEAYVPPNVTTDMQGRINGLTQMILNRASLTGLVNKHGLYKKELSRAPMDDVIENMRKQDILIGPVQTFAQNTGAKQQVPAFMIGFRYSNRYVAQKVTEDLSASFLSESMKESEGQTLGITEFLRSTWEDAKKRLDEAEANLQAFRARNLGHLPDQQQSNYSQINAIQVQMMNVDAAMSRVQQEKLTAENELRIAKQQLAQLKEPALDQQAFEQKNERLAQKDREIQIAETILSQARERYRDTHPDVQSAVAQLNALRRQRDQIAKEESAKKPEAPRPATSNPQYMAYEREKHGMQANIQRIEGAVQSKDVEMKTLQKESSRLSEGLKAYQARLESTPLGEKEYSQLMADRELARKSYEDLDRKMNMSKEAADVTHRQQGERLALLDPANLPITPTEPRRPIIIGVGAALGFVLGIVLAGAREVKDTSLKNLKDVRAYTQLQVLGSIPLLENDLVVRRRRRLSWLAWSTACLVGIVIMSSSVVYYYATKL